MNKKEYEALRKKTIRKCVLTVVIGALACIVPAIILRGMISYSSRISSSVPGSYIAAGVIAALIIVVIAVVCIRTFIGTLRYYKENSVPPLEIERKFLIRFPDLVLLESICTKKIFIVQTYLVSENNKSRRVRKSECAGKTVYRYNEKDRISNMTRIEREREISEEEYEDLMKEAEPAAMTINKTRYCIPSGELCFEVDIFPEWEDRAFAEVELEDEEQDYEIPDCLSVIKEVTDDRRYTNHAMALNGFVFDDI